MERNDLAAVPLRPGVMEYEYGYVTKRNGEISAGEGEALRLIEKEVKKEFRGEKDG